MSSFGSKDTLVATVATGLALAATIHLLRPPLAKFWAQRRLQQLFKEKRNNGDQADGTVSGLYIHPVKSLRAVSLKQVQLDDKGFQGDRRYMLVYSAPKPAWKTEWGPKDTTHRFLTQRQCPILATVKAQLEENNVVVLTCGTKSIRVDSNNKNKNSSDSSSSSTFLRAGIWDDQVLVQDMGDEAAAFVQAIVNSDDNGSVYQKIRLVYHFKNDRPTDAKFVPKEATTTWMGQAPLVSLADGFPVLIACQASLDALNARLTKQGKEAIPMSRFRPNLVIQGTKPFDEDTWKTIIIDKLMFSVVKGCPRCKQSCTDQETGKVSEEPVAIMKTFRNFNGDDVFFAQNAISLASTGTIQVGDTVTILEQGDPVYC